MTKPVMTINIFDFLFVGCPFRLRTACLVFAIVCLWQPASLASQHSLQPSEPPDASPTTIGLTLSGGGARGFAHIGVLHVLDSLGLKIDRVSGTSIGAVVGGLYAAGYSAGDIEHLALTTNWDQIFAGRSILTYVHPRKRRQSNKAMLEVPLEEGRLRLSSGVIEGQQLWNILENLFFHVRTIDDFSHFPIPFACVAADVETGDAVVMQQGDIVSALRASMAIPAVFSTVNREGHQLIDGGVVNNFPVDVVRDIGAEYVIGVYVSEGLKPAKRLTSPVDIIYQMGFFKDAFMFSLNKEQTDLFLTPQLEGFSAASFGDAQEIIERGKQIARSFIPELQKIIASQDSHATANMYRLHTQTQKVVVDTVIYHGLKNIRHGYIQDMIRINKGDSLSLHDINRMTERLFATDYFERVTYTYVPAEQHPGRVKLIFTFAEKPFTSIEASLHYSTFTGVGIIGGIMSNKFLLYNLNARVKARIGEQPAIQAGLDFYTNERQKTWISLQASGDAISFPVYERFEPRASYRQRYARAETTINRLTGPNSYITTGIAAYHQRLKPTMRTDFMVSGKNRGYEAFAALNAYTLNRHDLPQRGQNLVLKASFFMNQNPEIEIETDGQTSNDLSSIGIRIKDFLQVKLNWESYVPVHQRLSFYTRLQGGYNFNYTQDFINMFNLGGTLPFLRDQVTFAGLNEYEVMTASVISAAYGWQYHLGSDFYLSPMVNVAVYDFDQQAHANMVSDNVLMGASLSLGYLSRIGPLKTTVAYSPQTNRVSAYINLGWPF